MAFNKQKIKKIVVLAPKKAFFGANIVQIPLFQHLRTHFPDAEIVVWSPVRFTIMMQELNLVNKLYHYKGWKSYFTILSFLWRYRADAIINMRWVSEGMNAIAAFSLARYRIGFNKNKWSPFIPFFNRKLKLNEEVYMAKRYLDLLKPLGITDFFYFNEIKKLDALSTLPLPIYKKIVCMMPAGGEGEHKRWGIENFCSLGKLMQQQDTSILIYFVIGPKEDEYIPVIKNYFKEDEYAILQGGSIPDIVKVSKASALVIANDCGPSHLAQMCNTNYIGVWGWKEQHPQQRIISWTVARQNAVHVVANYGNDIKTIKPEAVMKVASGFIQD